MPEFKVGDRVRIVRSGHWDGHCGTVAYPPDRGQVIAVRLDVPPGVMTGVTLCDIEPAPESQP